LGLPWLVATLLGAILGGVSTAVVVSAIKNTSLRAETRTLVTLECVLVDVLTIAAAVTVLEIMRGGAIEAADIVRTVIISLCLGVIVGGLAALVEVALLPRLRAAGNHYILTLAMLLGSYGLTEYAGGSGPIAAFAFGLVLGNSRHLHSKRVDTAPELSQEIHRFHSQATFLVRTFFFVLLGLTFSPSIARGALEPRWTGLADMPPAALIMLAVAGAVAVILAARMLVVRWTVRTASERPVVSMLVGRGLGSAVLATFPFTFAEYRDPTSAYAQALGPYEALLPSFVGMVVVVTIIVTAVGLLSTGRRRATVVSSR
jgi:NhaP-type Na+/H+ or K+/H+ antiporter